MSLVWHASCNWARSDIANFLRPFKSWCDDISESYSASMSAIKILKVLQKSSWCREWLHCCCSVIQKCCPKWRIHPSSL